MKAIPRTAMEAALDWCAGVVGPVQVAADHTKTHGGHESATCRLLSPMGGCYLKVHESAFHWHNEVHAYEQWAGFFGAHAPRLLAVRDVAPLALVVSELPGQPLEGLALPRAQEQAAWRAAGAALRPLHDSAAGAFFGPCLRDGASAENNPRDAREYVSNRFQAQVGLAVARGNINAEELATIRAALDLLPAFAGEQPVRCHRDYCAANWLIHQGAWAGVIDFEFSAWDVRVADFSRDPDWNWIRRPDLVEAFFEGYGRALTPAEEQQRLVAYTEYALGAIIWGREHAFFGFEREGHEALAYLASKLR